MAGVKLADGAIVCVTVCLMGAPAVLGEHLNGTIGTVMFWTGLIALVAFVAWKVWRRGADEAVEGYINNTGGAFVGGDNSGALTIHNAPVTIHNTPLPPEKDTRPFVPSGTTPDRLFSFYDSNTDLQVHELTKVYLGLWMKVSGTVRAVSPFNGYFIQVAFKEKFGRSDATVFCLFREGLVDHLRLLKHGDKITVIGKFLSLDAISLNLDKCEIVAGPK